MGTFNEDMKLLTEMNRDDLLTECMRRKKVCETIWMGIAKHFQSHGVSKVMAYINNRRQKEAEHNKNILGDEYFVFQIQLSKDIAKILKKRKVFGDDPRGDNFVEGLIEGTINKALMHEQ